MRPQLLFVTQKVHEHDDDLAFVVLWIQEFIKQGFDVEVICLEKGVFHGSFPVYSLGKELGYGRLRRALRFLHLITTLPYDRVFVHMNPEYITLGGWWWTLRGVPIYLWYTHYVMNIHVFLAGILCKRMFAATPQSLPQFEGSPKKIIVGHGIDTSFWRSARNQAAFEKRPAQELLMVHRISRSKRVELGIQAIAELPQEYTCTIYGREIDPAYATELKQLVVKRGLGERIHFMGPVPMHELKAIYPQYRMMINMASETIDKTMVESMLFGVYPVTTKSNSLAIGLPVYPENDEPETLVKFITQGMWKKYDAAFLSSIVETRHSLPSLITAMSSYIRAGK